MGSGSALGASSQKKKVKEEARILEQITSSKKRQQEKRGVDKQTRAQAAFEKVQKQQVEQVLKKASKTHKQRVQEFKRHFGCSD
ncbi:hypothetical protein DUI87_22500 [Hirundo rustica rustica]|uniref:Uncharacterized protein n=1 Tax=Hirundo rustica rustica TaxID=333673 RepID=A0A3M0JIK0_HIRRU|nr:hypothetical protein DUI87_22500 [Hirundo rustica rustica]